MSIKFTNVQTVPAPSAAIDAAAGSATIATPTAPKTEAVKKNIAKSKQYDARNSYSTVITIRVPNEILAHFKANGRGYQTRIVDVLRQYASQKRSEKLD